MSEPNPPVTQSLPSEREPSETREFSLEGLTEDQYIKLRKILSESKSLPIGWKRSLPNEIQTLSGSIYLSANTHSGGDLGIIAAMGVNTYKIIHHKKATSVSVVSSNKPEKQTEDLHILSNAIEELLSNSQQNENPS